MYEEANVIRVEASKDDFKVPSDVKLTAGAGLDDLRGTTDVDDDPKWFISLYTGYRPQHLYLVNDKNIKKGDYYLYFMTDVADLMRCEDEEEAERCNTHPNISHISRKIVATTNKTLKDVVPLIHDSFVNDYAKSSYKEDALIDRVLVEYYIFSNIRGKSFDIKPKLDEDGYVTIKQPKENFTREEVIGLFKTLFTDDNITQVDSDEDIVWFIEQNSYK